jgi:hypothetical protein
MPTNLMKFAEREVGLTKILTSLRMCVTVSVDQSLTTRAEIGNGQAVVTT